MWHGTKRCFKFHFRKEISPRWGEGLMMSNTCTTREIEPQQYRAKQLADRQPQWFQQPRETPMDRGEIPMECRRGKSTMEPMRTQQPRETTMDRGEITVECRRREFMIEPMRMSPVQPRQRQKATSTAVLHHCTTWIGQPKSRQQAV